MTALVLRLGYVALNVTDMTAAARDAENIAGVRVVEKTATRMLMTSNQRHAELIFYKSDKNTVRCIGLEANNTECVAEVARRALDRGLHILSETPSLDAISHSVTFVTSEGHIFEVHTPMLCNQPIRYLCGGIHPRYIDHVNLTAENPKLIIEELVEVLGMKLSERSAGYEINWLRAGDHRHHTIGMVKGAPGLHHYSWEFADFADFKRLGDMLDADDRSLVWGPGRHGAGDNLFAYYLDSAGFLVECTAEMELIQHNEEPRIVDVGENLSNPKVVNRWGTLPPQMWIDHHSPFTEVR